MEEENTLAVGKITFMVGSIFFLELGLNLALRYNEVLDYASFPAKFYFRQLVIYAEWKLKYSLIFNVLRFLFGGEKEGKKFFSVFSERQAETGVVISFGKGGHLSRVLT